MPTFCSEKPEVSAKQLVDNAEYAFDCLQQLVSRLLARNELTREEAAEYARDPREGDFRKVLRRSWIPPEKGTNLYKKNQKLLILLSQYIILSKSFAFTTSSSQGSPPAS